jgi:hypothetical protein
VNTFFNIHAANIARLFPGTCSHYIIEFELKAPVQTVDISRCILKKEVGSLLEHWRKENLISRFRRDRVWERLSRFCDAWGDPDSSLNRYVSDVWFEFDNHQLDKALPGPCFLFSPGNLHKRSVSDPVATDWLFDSALSILFNEFLSAKVKEKVVNSIDALPEKGAIFQIGVMMSRNADRLRLCTSMPIDSYSGCLEKIGWQGSYYFLDKTLKSLKRYVDAVFIDVDVGESIYPGIGFECCYRGGVDIKARLEIFMEYLMEQRLCTQERADNVYSWIKNSGVLSHIKIVMNPDQSLKAKAYLAPADGDI